ncbi:MAG TPA: type II secretion system F family protein [Candidatus Lambdaproteobacteria bacterium]|jgi:type II secretory pathway component PulF|nr:general secretion pathway protein GspF [Deltaproteobacteria bacterium]HHZ78519.1 type II secretion system F family protein [Candidatus Lambdaproteobacteria bacterium]HIA57670.1 type II secretion system F family protein [Candidatus Lambdaproteobacteria bacterium]HIB46087.1 type II secretion system F family protein [Candidatus Lambdaproteobacteria bacterium]HIB93400.1 type II secretion system F family protein [Candidatus Lambdaproteobacteria bacterium]
MPIYNYQAFDGEGTLHKGTKDAASESEVRQYLRSKDLFPKEIRSSRFTRVKISAGEKTGKIKLPKFSFQHGVSGKVLTQFTRQLEVLLDATIPYDKAFQLIIPQTEDSGFQSVLSDVRGRVVEGGSLAGAMGMHPHVFPNMYVSMVRSGENAGNLGVIMSRLADYYEAQERLRSKLKGALIYPAFMMVFGLAVVIFMVTAIVPKITRIFESKEEALPMPTRILMGVSDFVVDHWFLLMLVISGIVVGITSFFRSKRGREWKDRIELKLPLLSRLRTKVMVARYCQTLGTLLKSGVDLKTALEISKHVVVNQIFINKLDQLIIDVNNKGVPLSAAMARIDYFPEYVRHVVSIGEEAARVDELLEKVAERMQEEVNNLLEALTTLLQPALILVLGGAVGFIALAVLLPMLNMSQILQ